jgi:hypothetical protein
LNFNSENFTRIMKLSIIASEPVIRLFESQKEKNAESLRMSV